MFRPTKTPFYIMTCMILYSHTQGKTRHTCNMFVNWLVMARVSVSFCAKRSVDLNDTTISMLSTRPSVGSQWTCSNRAMGRIFEWCPTGQVLLLDLAQGPKGPLGCSAGSSETFFTRLMVDVFSFPRGLTIYVLLVGGLEHFLCFHSIRK